MDKIEDDIEEDRQGRSKDEMDEKFLIKTVPNLIDGLQLDNNSVKIVKSPIIPKQKSSKFQSRLDAWVKRD